MQKTEFKQGVIYALAAYVMWGFAPLYFKLLDQVPAPEILMHRIIWSFALLFLLVLVSGQLEQVLQLLKKPKKLAVLLVTAVLVAFNWLVFIWAVNSDQILEASLGYFINPLLNVALGMIFLNERLPRLQLFAVALAACGVVIQLLVFGSIPWVSLVLAGSFGVYGLIKKKVQLKAITGLFVETAILLPLALLYWLQLDSDSSDFSDNSLRLNVTLICAGVITSLPLLAFAAAAVRIPYYMMGLFQYIGPSMMFVMAITLFGEVLDATKLTTFAFIWLALIIFVFDIWRQSKKRKAKQSASN
ncbi:MAG: EamA family transporter RarD [Pseudomonadales bacterium]|nr:EamA family transporter RarD [Pseudomonadales bacterium]NRA17060.1 EamA family transporter RarD [Oceanospirillaceae bacterium]